MTTPKLIGPKCSPVERVYFYHNSLEASAPCVSPTLLFMSTFTQQSAPPPANHYLSRAESWTRSSAVHGNIPKNHINFREFNPFHRVMNTVHLAHEKYIVPFIKPVVRTPIKSGVIKATSLFLWNTKYIVSLFLCPHPCKLFCENSCNCTACNTKVEHKRKLSNICTLKQHWRAAVA